MFLSVPKKQYWSNGGGLLASLVSCDLAHQSIISQEQKKLLHILPHKNITLHFAMNTKIHSKSRKKTLK